MDLPRSFDFLKNVEIVLRESVGDVCASYGVTSRGGELGDLVYWRETVGWHFAAYCETFTQPELADIAEALEALNALENGGRDE